jgi:hypothetical protein
MVEVEKYSNIERSTRVGKCSLADVIQMEETAALEVMNLTQ